MITLADHVRLHPGVVDTALDNKETVLLHLDSKLYYSLNHSGSLIWEGIKQGLTLKEISERLQKDFTVEPEHANRSVLELVQNLCDQRLVCEVEPS